MATTNGTTNFKSWEEVLDARIDLYKKASKDSSNPLEIIKITDQLNGVDYNGAFLKASRRQKNVRAVLRGYASLEDRALRGAEETEQNCEQVRESLDEFKDTSEGQTKEGWEKYLDDTIDTQKKKSDEHWETLRRDGKAIILQMPEDLREPAAHAYGGTLGAIAEFVRKAIDWCKGARATVVEWMKEAWEKINEWANNVKNWFVGAWNTVKSWFGAKAIASDAKSDWSRINWPVGDDTWKETEEWVRTTYNITHYRFYEQSQPRLYTYKLGVRVAGIGPSRTYEFATIEPDVYSLTVFRNGDHNVEFDDDSQEPRVVQIRMQGE